MTVPTERETQRSILAAQERFMRFVSVAGETECWIWKGGSEIGGYGKFQIDRQRKTGAHRASFELFRGPIPNGLVVRHKCDVKLCVNPAHLELGTQADNINDAIKRGRNSPPPVFTGTNHPRAKLSHESVLEARRRKSSGESDRSIARSLGVGATTLGHLFAGRTWRHI